MTARSWHGRKLEPPSMVAPSRPRGSYHAKAYAAQALRDYVGRRRAPRRPATSADRLRGLGHALGRNLRRPSSWRHIPLNVRIYVRTELEVRRLERARAVCAERGHVTYRPDASCGPLTTCARCVRCDYETHGRAGRGLG